MSYFEEIGGEIGLNAIISDFVDRVYADTMIGYLFSHVNRERLKRMEYEHAAEFLGAPIPYTGRSLRDAHKRHSIMGGHFGRRRQLLKNTLEHHHAPAHVIDAWLSYQDGLRAEVTGDEVTQCNGQSVPADSQTDARDAANGAKETP